MRKRRRRTTELASLLRFVEFTNKFRSLYRLIWYRGRGKSPDTMEPLDRQECNGEHVFQLVLVVWYMHTRFAELDGLELDRLMFYALVHDLVETYTNNGDTPAFVKGADGVAYTPCRMKKREEELRSMLRIEQEWGEEFPELVQYMRAYDSQDDRESRFVYALDKFLSEMNIRLDEGRTNHELGVTIADSDLYKRPKIEADPLIFELYEEHFRHMLANERHLFAMGREHVLEPVS